jgi:hypothetical protein
MSWSEKSAKAYPTFLLEAVGQDGDPRVLVLIKGFASLRHFRRKFPATVRLRRYLLPRLVMPKRRGYRRL